MAAFKKNDSGTWTAQIDLKKFSFRAKQTFATRSEAADWAGREEAKVRARGTNQVLPTKGLTIGELIADYIDQRLNKDKKVWSPSKQDNLDALARPEHLGRIKVSAYNRQVLFSYCAAMRAGTLPGMRGPRGASGCAERLIYLGTVFKFGRQERQLDAPVEEHKSGMAVLREKGENGGIAKSKRRNLNFKPVQIEAVEAELAGGQADLVSDIIGILKVIPFRVNELCSIKRSDLNAAERSVKLWDVKSKGGKGVHRTVSLTMIGDVDAYELLASRPVTPGDDRLFPIDSTTVSTRWSEANRRAGINVHVHDMRHHAISNMFAKLGWSVPAVTHYTGHLDWKTLAANYGQLDVDQMHGYAKRQAMLNAYAAKLDERMGHNGGPRLELAA